MSPQPQKVSGKQHELNPKLDKDKIYVDYKTLT
jgi:hypothetical protein